MQHILSTTAQLTCPSCSDEYTLGVNGTINGCDRCEGITRNPIDHSIIPDSFATVFVDNNDDFEGGQA